MEFVLQLVLYGVFMFSIVAYATLDGFDLGVGCLHLFTKGDNERRVMINAIGPVWDGNATWIVIGSGVLFAAFPRAFAFIGPNFYTPLMAMLFGFMLRAAAIEFRSKKPQIWWRRSWDIAFFLASFVLASIIGLILGNLIQGVAINSQGEFIGTLFSSYSLLIAAFGIVTFVMHGSLYLLMKTEGVFHKKMRLWVKRLIALFLLFWIATTFVTWILHPHMTAPFIEMPLLSIIPLLSFVVILAIPRAVKKGKDGLAFCLSCLSIFFLLLFFVIGTFPYIIYATPEQNSFTFANSSVSLLALWVLVIVSLSALPLSFFYISYIHRVFKGKVKIDSMSY